jgi:hypothetical protein
VRDGDEPVAPDGRQLAAQDVDRNGHEGARGVVDAAGLGSVEPVDEGEEDPGCGGVERFHESQDTPYPISCNKILHTLCDIKCSASGKMPIDRFH